MFIYSYEKCLEFGEEWCSVNKSLQVALTVFSQITRRLLCPLLLRNLSLVALAADSITYRSLLIYRKIEVYLIYLHVCLLIRRYGIMVVFDGLLLVWEGLFGRQGHERSLLRCLNSTRIIISSRSCSEFLDHEVLVLHRLCAFQRRELVAVKRFFFSVVEFYWQRRSTCYVGASCMLLLVLLFVLYRNGGFRVIEIVCSIYRIDLLLMLRYCNLFRGEKTGEYRTCSIISFINQPCALHMTTQSFRVFQCGSSLEKAVLGGATLHNCRACCLSCATRHDVLVLRLESVEMGVNSRLLWVFDRTRCIVLHRRRSCNRVDNRVRGELLGRTRVIHFFCDDVGDLLFGWRRQLLGL